MCMFACVRLKTLPKPACTCAFVCIKRSYKQNIPLQVAGTKPPASTMAKGKPPDPEDPY